MWTHNDVARVSVDDRWADLCVAIDAAVNAITDSEVVGCDADGDILALVDRTGFVYCCNHDSAVHAVANLHELHVRINVDVGVFTPNNPYILVLDLVLPH